VHEDFPLWAWAAFAGALLPLLGLDLFLHRGGREASRRAAIAWSVVWVVAGLAFGGFVWATWGHGAALDYLAAWVIEKGLSLDNLFVFLLIFGSLRIPPERQHAALAWGVLGALVFRGVFVAIGVAAFRAFEWIQYVFGAVLLYAAWRALRENPLEKRGKSGVVRWLSKRLPVTHQLDGDRFLVHEDGRRQATPLLVAVVALELTDIVFAVDSVPAAFSVTREPFLVYTSNAFAILGLRALYLVLAKTIVHLRYLHYGLSAVLAFAAVKMVIDRWLHIPAGASIAVVFACLGLAWWASVRAERREGAREERAPRRPEPARR
jgi:tellurite resistance protein TerC